MYMCILSACSKQKLSFCYYGLMAWEGGTNDVLDFTFVIYHIASNICGNLIVCFAVGTENAQFYSAQYYFHAICIGITGKGERLPHVDVYRSATRDGSFQIPFTSYVRILLNCCLLSWPRRKMKSSMTSSKKQLITAMVYGSCGVVVFLRHYSSSWSMASMWLYKRVVLWHSCQSQIVRAYVITCLHQPLLSYVGMYGTV